MPTEYDYIIIGAGPAGLQLAYWLACAGRSYLVLEAGPGPGTFFKTFPRHRKLISINKVYTGIDDDLVNQRWDWNSLLSDDPALRFKHYSARYFPAADDLVRYLEDFTARHALNVAPNRRVTRVSRPGRFLVEDSQGSTYSCGSLVVATGVSRSNIPAIPGIELAEPYDTVPTDPAGFANQRVLIIGKGNSAFETADNLIEDAALIHLVSPQHLRLAWKTHFVGHLRAVNNNLLDTYLLKAQNAVIDGTVERISQAEDGLRVEIGYTHAHGAQTQQTYDRVIVCCGFRFDDSIFADDCRPELAINGRFPAQTSAWESTNVPGLYFAGTIMQMRDYRSSQSGFIHGFRHNLQALYAILEQRNHCQPLPHRPIPPTPDGIMGAVLESVNRNPALWLQTGFLCNVIALPHAGGAAYYQTLPSDFVRDGWMQPDHDYYVVTLEYGPDYPSYPFEFDRFVQPDQSHLNPQLHPVIRRYSGGALSQTWHIMENLAGHWRAGEATQALQAFLDKQHGVAVGATGTAS